MYCVECVSPQRHFLFTYVCTSIKDSPKVHASLTLAIKLPMAYKSLTVCMVVLVVTSNLFIQPHAPLWCYQMTQSRVNNAIWN